MCLVSLLYDETPESVIEIVADLLKNARKSGTLLRKESAASA